MIAAADLHRCCRSPHLSCSKIGFDAVTITPRITRRGSNLIRRQTITAQVIDHILGLIRTGEVRVGGRLPTEKQLTEELSVSRTCVREAIKSLESLRVDQSAPPRRRGCLRAVCPCVDQCRVSFYSGVFAAHQYFNRISQDARTWPGVVGGRVVHRRGPGEVAGDPGRT